MKRKLLLFLAVIGTVVFATQFYFQYWQYRNLFDTQGRYFNESQGVVFHAQSGIAWGGLTLFCLGLVFALAFRKR